MRVNCKAAFQHFNKIDRWEQQSKFAPFCGAPAFHYDAHHTPNCSFYSLHSLTNRHGFALDQNWAVVPLSLAPVPAIIGLKQPLHLGASSAAVQLLHQTLLFSLSMKGSLTKDV